MKLDALGSLIRWFCRKAVSHVLNHKWYLILKLHFLLSAKRPRLKKENTAKKNILNRLKIKRRTKIFLNNCKYITSSWDLQSLKILYNEIMNLQF